MSYVMPDGDNIEFVFSTPYTEPYGDSSGNFIIQNGTEETTGIEFIFEDGEYAAPDEHGIVFWFGAAFEIELQTSSIDTNSTLSFGIPIPNISTINLTSYLSYGYDTTISLPISSVNTKSFSDYDSDSLTKITIPLSIINSTSSLEGHTDYYYSLPISSVISTPNLDYLSDYFITLPVSTTISSGNIDCFISSDNLSLVSTNSEFNYNKATISNVRYYNNIGKTISDFNYIYKINEPLYNDFEYKNTYNIESNLNYINGIYISVDCEYNNEIISNISSEIEYYFNIINNVISDNKYLNGLSVISVFEYDNIIIGNIINNFNYINSCSIIESDINYTNGHTVNSDCDYSFKIVSNISDDYNYVYNLYFKIESECNFINGISIDSDFEYLNVIFTDIISDASYDYQLITKVYEDFEYNNGLIVYVDFVYDNLIGIGIYNDLIYNYNLTEDVINNISYKNEIIGNIIINQDFKYTNYIESEGFVYHDDEINVNINGLNIEFTSFNISINEGDYCYSLTASLLNVDDWSLCKTGEIIQITVNSVLYEFIIDGRTRTREFNSTVYQINGRSKSSVLGQGYYNNITKTWPAVFISQVIDEILIDNNIEYEFNLNDWSIPNELLSVDNATPISIVENIIDASGGIIVCDPVGKIYIDKKYSECPSIYTSFEQSFNDYLNIFSVSETKEINPKWNAVVVYNINDDTGYSYSLQEIYIEEDFDKQDPNLKQIRLTVYPFLDNVDLHTSYMSSSVDINPLNNPINEVIEGEIVEIISGEGNTSKPILNIISYEYLNTNLGTLEFSDTLINTQISGQSLIKISYTTQYHDFMLSNNSGSEYIQTYTTDENEG